MREDEFAYLASLPPGSVLSVCGAGGKTTLIKRLRNTYLTRGRKVLITTSTHMLNEGNLKSSAQEIAEALETKGAVFAGTVDPDHPEKIRGLTEDVFSEAVRMADVTLVEADGARHMPFKVPYPHEPVILPGTTHIVVLYGEEAAGRTIRRAAYNPEGTAAVLGLDQDDVLDEERMKLALGLTYVAKMNRLYPGIPVFCCPARRSVRPKIHFILLAAGYSARFGSNKLLYRIDGKPMYRRVLDSLLEVRSAGEFECDVTVVTQYDEILEDVTQEPGIIAAVNPDPSRGISSSVRTGISALYGKQPPEEGDYFFFVNADQPYLRGETCRNLIQGTISSGLPLSSLSYGGEMYSPCMFGTDFVPDLMGLEGDRGGKRILRNHPGRVFLFEPGSKEELEDIDML